MLKATGYFNNLALAYRFLGQLRHAMETSGAWDKSWVIISADHSWRDSRIYDGVIDLRVPFLVKAPGAGQHLNICAPNEHRVNPRSDPRNPAKPGNQPNQRRHWLDGLSPIISQSS